jgi:hypothetical protein
MVEDQVDAVNDLEEVIFLLQEVEEQLILDYLTMLHH